MTNSQKYAIINTEIKRERYSKMKKTITIIVVTGLVALTFVLGVTIGEKRVIKQQRIEKTDYGYLVEFDGQLYDYTAD